MELTRLNSIVSEQNYSVLGNNRKNHSQVKSYQRLLSTHRRSLFWYFTHLFWSLLRTKNYALGNCSFQYSFPL